MSLTRGLAPKLLLVCVLGALVLIMSKCVISECNEKVVKEPVVLTLTLPAALARPSRDLLCEEIGSYEVTM